MSISYHVLKPPSGRAIFRGFPEHYQSEIGPYLAAREAERRSGLTLVGGVFGAGVILALILFALRPFGEASSQVAAMAAFAGLALGGVVFEQTRRKISDGLMSRICARMGFDYRGAFDRPDYAETFLSLKMLPSFNRETWEDEVAGVYRGVSFVLCETDLKVKTSGKNKSTRTVFHGQLIAIDYPERFLGRTVVRRDAGVLNRLGRPGRDFSRVGLASPKFEKAFEAWSTDQVEARDLLDPVVLERFIELERLFGDAKLRAAFAGGKLLIALETGDRLNMGSMFKPLARPERVEAILKEFDVIFDLIDVAAARTEGRIDGPFSLDQARRAGTAG